MEEVRLIAVVEEYAFHLVHQAARGSRALELLKVAFSQMLVPTNPTEWELHNHIEKFLGEEKV